MDTLKPPSQPGRPERLIADLPLGTDPLSVRRRVEALERMLEGAVAIPLLRRKVGLDAIVGLIPVAGDLVTAAMGLYLVWEARNLGLSRWRLWRMLATLGFDAALGAVPLAGDLIDLFYRSNTRNLRIIRRHLDEYHPASKLIEG